MAGAKKKGRKGEDPISERASALNSQIAALQAEIKKIDSQLQSTTKPKLRSTAMPHGATVPRLPEKSAADSAGRTGGRSQEPRAEKPVAHEPVFEEIKTVQTTDDSSLYNDLGVRKYDLPALLRRIRNHFRGPSTNNPKLVHYLAAGGVQGLRPLRYEKRVARNRLIALVIVLVAIGLGLILVFVKHH
jgi:hypothetical protein